MPITGYAPPTTAQAAPDLSGFATWPRARQIAYLNSTYGSVEDRARANGVAPALATARFRGKNSTQPWISPDEQALWGQVNRDGGTWLGNALSQAAPYALAAGGIAAGGTAAGLWGGGGAATGAATGAAGAGAAGAGSTGAGLGIFSNGGAAGLAGVGGGSAGALAASGGLAGTGAGAVGLGGFANTLGGAASAAGGSMGWDWGRILDYAAPIVGGLLEGNGAKDAARTAAAGSEAAIAETRRQYDTSRADQMPWLNAGTAALGRLEDPANSFSASPNYQFVRDEGMRDIGNSFAARGGALGGNALRALTERNANVASGEFGNWLNQQAGLAGVGQSAANTLGTLGANSASNIGSAMQNGANARASGVAGQTNAMTGTIENLLSTWNRRRAPQYTGGWYG